MKISRRIAGMSDRMSISRRAVVETSGTSAKNPVNQFDREGSLSASQEQEPSPQAWVWSQYKAEIPRTAPPERRDAGVEAARRLREPLPLVAESNARWPIIGGVLALALIIPIVGLVWHFRGGAIEKKIESEFSREAPAPTEAAAPATPDAAATAPTAEATPPAAPAPDAKAPDAAPAAAAPAEQPKPAAPADKKSGKKKKKAKPANGQ